MIRYPDWEVRLAAYLEPLREEPFAWGRHDCCIFAAGAVLAMTGTDAMAEFRGRYSTKRGSAVALGRHGKGSLAATLDAKFEGIPVGHAHRGDIVMADGTLGIGMGAFSIHVGAVGERQGLIRKSRSEWTRAWCVPMPDGADRG